MEIHRRPALETRCLRSRGPRAEVHPEAPGEGPSRLFRLLGAPGIHPWAGGRLPPVSASVSTWLLLRVHVSPLVCLIRTLTLGLGPPPSRRNLSSDLYSITSSETLYPNKVLLWGSSYLRLTHLFQLNPVSKSRKRQTLKNVINKGLFVASFFSTWILFWKTVHIKYLNQDKQI